MNLHFKQPGETLPPAPQSRKVTWKPKFSARLSAKSRPRLAGSRTAPQTQAGNTSVRSSLSQHPSHRTSPPPSYLGVSHGWCNTFAARFPGAHKAPRNKVWEIVRTAFTRRGEDHSRGRQEQELCHSPAHTPYCLPPAKLLQSLSLMPNNTSEEGKNNNNKKSCLFISTSPSETFSKIIHM